MRWYYNDCTGFVVNVCITLPRLKGLGVTIGESGGGGG